METRYNIYFEGQLLDGHEEAGVRAALGKLFNADENTLDRLFGGKTQLLKKGCDEQTAEKYRGAMARVGAMAIVRPVDEAGETTPTSSTAAPESQSAAEKIAALAAGGTDPRFDTGADAESNAAAPAEESPQVAQAQDKPSDDGSLGLAPAGTEVLREQERQKPVEADIDTSALSADAEPARLSPEPPAPPPAPDTSHLEMGAVGETIPGIARNEAPLDPDISALDLAPEGGDFSDCAAPPAAEPELDLSGIDLAPEGSEVLEDQYRKKETARAPSTDHLTTDS